MPDGYLARFGIPTPQELGDNARQRAMEAREHGTKLPGFITPLDVPIDALATMAAPVPILGDVLGAVADANMYATDPESRTLPNFALSASGLLPWVPNAAAMSGLGGAALAMFAGPGAKTADLAAMKRAQQMAESGDDARDIWRETGWFEGPDGQWRFEIDDSGASLKRSLDELDEFGRPISSDMAISHDTLYQAYPNVADVPWYRTPELESGGGSYDEVRGIRVGSGPGYAFGNNGPVGVSLHELQHAVQNQESFASGGSKIKTGLSREKLFEQARRAYEDANGFNGGLSDEALLAELLGEDIPVSSAKSWDDLPERERLAWLDQGRDRAYRRLAGEAEARAVQRRMDYTPEQRRDVFPLDDYDVPLDELIVRRDAGGPQMSAPLDMSTEARMARAREMGFDVDNPVYHGSPDARGLDEGFATLEERFSGGERKGPYFFADDYKTASTYADDRRAFDYQNAEPEVMKGYLRQENPLSINAGGANFNGIEISRVLSSVPEDIREQASAIIDSMPTRDGKLRTDDLAKVARQLGFDSINISNVRDHYNNSLKTKSTTVRMMLTDKGIRRDTAAFDPAKRDSANLLASFAAPLSGGALAAATLPQFVVPDPQDDQAAR